ncbi:uncharacterized protein [Mycetomoellerius zeteki]|uniref:uncharacterized protein isoform X2 n=1 Tax=Mycetomoellerius zeteki TaxID=64791 RepID=UPI00084EB21D|nr:PREDICTED: uncharacterized protein LOC108722553 isoform X2 [Trachymyrmex zeteki]
MTISKTEKKQQTRSSLHNNPTKQSNKINKLTKHSFVKKNRKKNMVDETEKIENRKREMERLKNMFKSFAGILGDIQPAVLPEELLAISQRTPEKKTEKIDFSATDDEEEIRRIKKEPCGWKTKSEQELPAKKTLTYLCEPDYPLETIAVRPGGRPCQCRENRNKKKILTYNVSGLVEKKRDERRADRRKLKEENRIIDGVLYVTPPVSPRRSDEYVPEYDLLDSPYDMCVSEATDERLKLIEKYSGPKSLIEKIRKKPKSCNCCNNVVIKEDHFIDQKRDLEETRKKFMESKSSKERWQTALKDAALIDYFTQRDNNVPCWTTCKKIARSYRPHKLKVVKPVCECKYERKIVERNEERMKWKIRQRRLKDLKKQSFMHVVDISRPMIEDKKFIISDVKRIPREDEEDENKYSKKIIDEVDYQQNVSHKQIEKTKEKIDDKSHRINGGGDKKYVNKFDQSLTAIMKVELKKMAAEGYTFAKLPKCYLMPQLQDWVMYRQGVVFSETDKKNLMQETRTIWDITSRKMPMQIEKPSLHMTKHQLKRLTFDQAEKIKKKIEKIKEVFHSEVRKTRVSYARMMWSTMEHGKFPSASFKRTFFTYMASKEANGHVYKPWLPSEIRGQDLNFCCQ